MWLLRLLLRYLALHGFARLEVLPLEFELLREVHRELRRELLEEVLVFAREDAQRREEVPADYAQHEKKCSREEVPATKKCPRTTERTFFRGPNISILVAFFR